MSRDSKNKVSAEKPYNSKEMSTDEMAERIEQIVLDMVDKKTENFLKDHRRHIVKEDGAVFRHIRNKFIESQSIEDIAMCSVVNSSQSRMGHLFEDIAKAIAPLGYTIVKFNSGVVNERQAKIIGSLLEDYQNCKSETHKLPSVSDYKNMPTNGGGKEKPIGRLGDIFLTDEETGVFYIIECKTSGELDTKKARSEKEALMQQYSAAINAGKSPDQLKIILGVARNDFGEGNEWGYDTVKKFFSDDELLIGRNFWNFITKRNDGYDIVTRALSKAWKKFENARSGMIKEYIDAVKGR